MTDQLLTAQEVAKQLRRDVQFVNRLAKDGLIGAEKVGRYWRFTQADVDAYRARVRNHVVDPLAMSTASASRRRTA